MFSTTVSCDKTGPSTPTHTTLRPHTHTTPPLVSYFILCAPTSDTERRSHFSASLHTCVCPSPALCAVRVSSRGRYRVLTTAHPIKEHPSRALHVAESPAPLPLRTSRPHTHRRAQASARPYISCSAPQQAPRRSASKALAPTDGQRSSKSGPGGGARRIRPTP